MQPISVRIICKRDDKILVILRHKDGQDFTVLPGGHMEEGEDVFTTAERECLEETSIKVTAQKLLLELEPHDKFDHQKIVLCNYISGEPMLDPASIEAQKTHSDNTYTPVWMPLDQAKSQILPAPARVLL